MDFSKIEWLEKVFIIWLVKFITLSGSIKLLVDFITLSRSIALSGVYYIIRAKWYNLDIWRYSSSFYGGHFKNRFSNPTGHIKWISNYLNKILFITLSAKFRLLGIITLLVDFTTLSRIIALSGVNYIIGAKYYNWYISRYSFSFYGGHFKNKYPNPAWNIKWILARSNNSGGWII